MLRKRWTIIFAGLIFLVKCPSAGAQDAPADPHRPTCTTAECKSVRLYVKSHYCGTPEGNGPDDSCDILSPQSRTDLKIVARYACNWINGAQKCQQFGQPSAELADVLTNTLRQLGLPLKIRGQIYFTVWQPIGLRWSLVEAYYDHIAGEEDEELCQVIGLFGEKSHLTILKKVPFQTVDADKNNVTTWSPLDLADVKGNGKLELILRGDAYEDHWIEVDAIEGASFKRIFSGLGYYL
jgi:hypothetical protein